MPKISVVLPVYNGARYISRAIESVGRQTFTDWELIVLDDGSTDATSDVIRPLAERDRRIRYLRNPENLGVQKSLNRGLREARGECIARIDDDDWWEDAQKLEKQVEFLDSHPDAVLVGTGTIVVNEEGKELIRFLQPETDAEIRGKILFRNCFTHSSVVFRKDLALRFGGYSEDEKVRHVEDYDLWLKLGTVGKLANLPDYSVRFTLRLGNISSRNKLEQLGKDIQLVKRYRKFYPNFGLAIVFAYVRYALYRLLPFIPFGKTILKLYKSG